MKRVALAVLVAALGGTALAAPRHSHAVATRTASGGGEDSLNNLKRWMPVALQTWQDEIPEEFYTPATKWLTEFDGTAAPIRAVLINGEKRFIGTVCKTGYCVNRAEVMIAPGRVAGVAHFEKLNGNTAQVLIGSFKEGELSCLEKLKGDPAATSC